MSSYSPHAVIPPFTPGEDNNLSSKDVSYRLLKAFLECAPTAEGKEVIASDLIAASEEEDGLMQIARFYTTGLILTPEPPFDNLNDGSVIGLMSG